MGQFSWLYSDTGKQVVDNKTTDSFLLVPPPFQKKYGRFILETCYDGYGHFGGHDVYDLVAEWNREFLSKDMLRDEPKRENFGGLFDFEKERLICEGYSGAEIIVADNRKRDEYYNNAVERYNKAINRLNDYRNGMSDNEMLLKYGPEWKRYIGIDIACYDEQNESLPYPIKIASEDLEYERVAPSLSDPDQGWEY